MKITLVDTEIEVARHLAGLRISRNRAAGATATPYGGKDQETLDIDAMGAELAYCKIFNLFPDLTTNPRQKGWDVEHFGRRVDVKQTNLQKGRLLARSSKKVEDADVYVLMRGALPEYDFSGWCYAGELISENTLQEIKGVTTYVLPNALLRDPETIYCLEEEVIR